MSRNPSAPQQVLVVVAALVAGGISLVALRSGDDSVELTAAEAASAGLDGVRPAGLRLASNRAGVELTLPPAIPAAAAPAEAAQPAPETTAAPQPKDNGGNDDKKKEDEHKHGYTGDLHNFAEHVTGSLGVQMLAPGQGMYGTYEYLGPKNIKAKAPITGLRPVIEQAISDVKEREPGLRGEELEERIAQRLTELNDWENLTNSTRAKMMILAGMDIESMSGEEREHKINHLLHSPQPFGDIPEILAPDTTIDLGYTHTLDKDWTKAVDLGNGVFQIWMVSNNDNGSHTGHSLGSFKVQLPPGATEQKAREVGNQMVVNRNKNERLYLDLAARNILYGQTPLLDFSQKPPETTTSTTAVPVEPTPTVVPETTTTVHQHDMSTTTVAAETTTTVDPSTVASSTTVTAPATPTS